MRLNEDCVRDILLTVEENASFRKGLVITHDETLPEQIAKYDFETIAYHIKQCYSANLLEKGNPTLSHDFYIEDLTPFGHEFLSNIREQTNWGKIKEVSAKVGATSLNAITQIASNVITQIIQAQFN